MDDDDDQIRGERDSVMSSVQVRTGLQKGIPALAEAGQV